jgi:hypothetical protein
MAQELPVDTIVVRLKQQKEVYHCKQVDLLTFRVPFRLKRFWCTLNKLFDEVVL